MKVADISAHNGILVGVDGSSCSTAAVRWAAREAAMRNVPLTVVFVVFPPVDAWSGWGLSTAPLPEDFGPRQERQSREVVDDAVAVAYHTIGGSDLIQVKTEILWSSLVPTLVDLTKEARMIVVGCRGQGALSRALLGSVSTALVHHAHCPVAVIHEDGSNAADLAEAPVLVGIDGSPASELATAIAFDEASWRGVDLVALHAWSDADWSEYDLEWSSIKMEAQETLSERLAGYRDRYPDVNVRQVVVFDYPARHLLDRSRSAQLVVVGSHGRGGFAGMLLGSVSSAVVQGAHVPVIVARHR